MPGIKLISCFQKHTVASSEIVVLGLAETDWWTQMVCSWCVCLARHYRDCQSMGFLSLLRSTPLSLTLKLKSINSSLKYTREEKHSHIHAQIPCAMSASNHTGTDCSVPLTHSQHIINTILFKDNPTFAPPFLVRNSFWSHKIRVEQSPSDRTYLLGGWLWSYP